MPAIALHVNPDELVGFLLIAGGESLRAGTTERDCILSGVPSAAALFDHELGAFVQDHKNIEYSCVVEHDGEQLTAVVAVDPNVSIRLSLSANGTGQWWVAHDSRRSVPGLCRLTQNES